MTPEGKVKSKIDKLLLGRADTWFFKPVQSGRGKPALDYIGCTRGHFWAVEAKRPGEEPTAFQRLTIIAMLNAEGAVFKISGPDGLRAFESWLVMVK